MFEESCDECGKDGFDSDRYIRVQQWHAYNFEDTLERVFCSIKCMKKYIEDWDDDQKNWNDD